MLCITHNIFYVFLFSCHHFVRFAGRGNGDATNRIFLFHVNFACKNCKRFHHILPMHEQVNSFCSKSSRWFFWTFAILQRYDETSLLRKKRATLTCWIAFATSPSFLRNISTKLDWSCWGNTRLKMERDDLKKYHARNYLRTNLSGKAAEYELYASRVFSIVPGSFY